MQTQQDTFSAPSSIFGLSQTGAPVPQGLGIFQQPKSTKTTKQRKARTIRPLNQDPRVVEKRKSARKFAYVNADGKIDPAKKNTLGSLFKWWDKEYLHFINNGTHIAELSTGLSAITTSGKAKTIHDYHDVAIADLYIRNAEGVTIKIPLMICGRWDNIVKHLKSYNFFYNAGYVPISQIIGTNDDNVIDGLVKQSVLSSSYNIFNVLGRFHPQLTGTNALQLVGYDNDEYYAPLHRALIESGAIDGGTPQTWDGVIYDYTDTYDQYLVQFYNQSQLNPISSTHDTHSTEQQMVNLVKKYIATSKYLKDAEVCRYSYMKEGKLEYERIAAAVVKKSRTKPVSKYLEDYAATVQEHRDRGSNDIVVMNVSKYPGKITMITTQPGNRLSKGNPIIEVDSKGSKLYFTSDKLSSLETLLKEINVGTEQTNLALKNYETLSKARENSKRSKVVRVMDFEGTRRVTSPMYTQSPEFVGSTGVEGLQQPSPTGPGETGGATGISAASQVEQGTGANALEGM